MSRMNVKDIVIPKVAPNAISKPKAKPKRRSKANITEEQRAIINQKERNRTSTMNSALLNLKAKLGLGNSSKSQIIEMTNHYLEFLTLMATNEAAFNKYSIYTQRSAFQFYLLERGFLVPGLPEFVHI